MYVNLVIYLWNSSVLATLKFSQLCNKSYTSFCMLWIIRVYVYIGIYYYYALWRSLFTGKTPMCVTAMDECVYTL